MQDKKIYIANFKMFLNFKQEQNWLLENLNELSDLTNQNLIIAPNYVSLAFYAQNLNLTKIKLSAQNCSSFSHGAYTGQVNAASLAEVGCSYCIIGHYETRKYFGETNETIAQKIPLLIKNKITPIICIGENKEQYLQNKSVDTIQEQLKLIINGSNDNEIILAYEPIWAIGTDKTPTNEYLDSISNFIIQELNKTNIKYKLVYGGSVNSKNISNLKKLKYFDGFLIGKASTDFQEFKKIVISV